MFMSTAKLKLANIGLIQRNIDDIYVSNKARASTILRFYFGNNYDNFWG